MASQQDRRCTGLKIATAVQAEVKPATYQAYRLGRHWAGMGAPASFGRLHLLIGLCNDCLLGPAAGKEACTLIHLSKLANTACLAQQQVQRGAHLAEITILCGHATAPACWTGLVDKVYSLRLVEQAKILLLHPAQL